MGRKRMVILAVLAALFVHLLVARPARALKSSDALIIGGIGVGVLVVVIGVGTYLVYGRDTHFLAPEADLDLNKAGGRSNAVKFGVRCKPVEGGVPLVCW